MSSDSFTQSLCYKQALELHHTRLTQKGFSFLENKSDRGKLHDLHDWYSDTWIECKTDHTRRINRALIEVFANVPVDITSKMGLGYRLELDHEWVARIQTIDATYFALAKDVKNTETRHYLSYLWTRTNLHCLVDLSYLRQQITERRYNWLCCGHEREDWRSICAVVPVEDMVSMSIDRI